MKKLCIALVVIVLMMGSSINVLAEKPDKSSPPPKTTTTKDLKLPAFEAKSQHLNWGQKGDFTVYIGKNYSPLAANSLLRSMITYSSSDNEILTISEAGSITPLKTGAVVIFATQGSVTIGKKLTVKVNPNPVASDKNKGIELSVDFYSYSDIVKAVTITDPEQVNYILSVMDTKVPLPKGMEVIPYMGGGGVLKIVRNGVVEENSFTAVNREIVKSDGSNELETEENTYGIISRTGDVLTYYTVTTDLSTYLFDKFYG